MTCAKSELGGISISQTLHSPIAPRCQSAYNNLGRCQEASMSNQIQQDEKRRIEAEIAMVQAELERLAVKLEYKPEWSLGQGDPAVQEWDLNVGLKRDAERRLKSLQNALTKLAQGSYAICEICGAP